MTRALGEIALFVEPVDRVSFRDFDVVLDAVRAGRPVAVATLLDRPHAGAHLVVLPGSTHGTLASSRLDAVREDALGLLAQGASQVLRYGADGQRLGDEIGVFVNSFAPRRRMIVLVRSTSPRPSPELARSWVTESPSAMPRRRSRRARAFPRRTRWWSSGRSATWRGPRPVRTP
jgi:xanthine/CO dehydrogenase XdhC/CoxF family maturation factor